MDAGSLRDDPVMRRCPQKVATGPEYNKDLTFEETHDGGHDQMQTGDTLAVTEARHPTA